MSLTMLFVFLLIFDFCFLYTGNGLAYSYNYGNNSLTLRSRFCVLENGSSYCEMTAKRKQNVLIVTGHEKIMHQIN